ncbi:MAG: glycosyltransferase family 2 protein [Flavobacteriales bacterium]
MTVAVIIPAYNEEANIAAVVGKINELEKQSGFTFVPIVINDGSLDQTGEIIRKLSCIDLHLPLNQGIGAAVQTGLLYAQRNNFDYAVQVDGDGQHPIANVYDMLKAMEQQQADVVIGSRYIENVGYRSTFVRRIGIRYFEYLNYLLVGVRITDNTSGLRLYNKKAIDTIVELYPDDYPEPEAIVLFKKKGLKFIEIPVVMHERTGGKSSITFSRSIYYMVKVSLALIFASIRKRK